MGITTLSYNLEANRAGVSNSFSPRATSAVWLASKSQVIETIPYYFAR